jgi:DNA-binding NtrC family response regulator
MARILVVDDEVGIRELLSEILYDEGHTIELAENAAQARAARLRGRPDLVLLDIWMPDTDGVTLLKEWNAAGLLDMPVIMMSGHATIDTAVEATKIGAIDFLEKPITLQRLLKTISTGLARGRSTVAKSASGVFAPVNSQIATPVAATALAAAPAPVVAPVVALDQGLLGDISLDQPLREARDEFERVYFEYHLARENNSMTRVSDKTGLERTHLYRKLKQLGIEARKRSS